MVDGTECKMGDLGHAVVTFMSSVGDMGQVGNILGHLKLTTVKTGTVMANVLGS